VLVGISTLIAFAVAWYITDSWLQKFAYRIHLEGEWLTFIVSALMAALITLVTIGYHVLRAASANPVKALRDE
jgi:putative ABC transport system permease protein